MGSLIWKMKQLFRQMVPLAVVGALLWGGYQYLNNRSFRRAPVQFTLAKTLGKLPGFGSYFRGASRHSQRSYAHGNRGKRGRARHSGRRHRSRRR